MRKETGVYVVDPDMYTPVDLMTMHAKHHHYLRSYHLTIYHTRGETSSHRDQRPALTRLFLLLALIQTYTWPHPNLTL